MSHSHMPVNHLLKQVETYRSKRMERDVRPGWVTKFINQAADLFEPTADVGRVGFDCQMAEDCWRVGMYLGSTEIVGGKQDGQSRYTNFEFDLLQLMGLFMGINRFRWNAFPNRTDANDSPACSYIEIEGRVDENPIRLRVYSTPPPDAGPGFREYPDGRRETV